MLKKYFPFLFVPVFYLADQISKQVVLGTLPENTSYPVVPGVFYLTHVNNTGAAFGLFRGAGLLLIVVTFLSISLLFSYLLLKWKSVRPLEAWGWILVIGGALGNLHDRLLYRHVIDFLDFRIWPVFNIADTCICVGVFCVLWNVFRTHAPHSI